MDCNCSQENEQVVMVVIDGKKQICLQMPEMRRNKR